MSTLKIETREQFEAWLEDNAVDWAGPGEVVTASNVRELYDALRPRWVPVSERVPTEDGRYLIRVVTAGWPEKTPYTTVMSFHGGFYDSPNIWNITHWSSLPPLPEES